MVSVCPTTAFDVFTAPHIPLLYILGLSRLYLGFNVI